MAQSFATRNPENTRFQLEMAAIVLIEIADLGLYLATEKITAGSGNDFANSYTDELDAIEGMGQLTQSIEPSGGTSSSGNLTLILLNQEKRSDLLNTYPHPEGDVVNIYVIFDDGTDLVYNEKIQIFSGIIVDFSFSQMALEFEIADGKHLFERNIPDSIIDVGAYPSATKDSIGRPLALAFGDFTDDSTYKDAVNFPNELLTWKNSSIPCIPTCGISDKTIVRHLITDHVLYTFGAHSMLMWLEEFGVFMELNNEATRQNTSAPTYIDWEDSIIKGKFRIRMAELHEQDGGDVTNSEWKKLMDDDESTYCSVGNDERLVLKSKTGTLSNVVFDYLAKDEVGIYVLFGTNVGTGNALVSRIKDAGRNQLSRSGPAAGEVTTADNDSWVYFYWNVGDLDDTVEELFKNGWEFWTASDYPNPGDTISLQIKDMFFVVKDFGVSLIEKTTKTRRFIIPPPNPRYLLPGVNK
uniref:Uncharacterized protein n=1 Tax=viral metagenome TaxID=1070528 RepID=A0A6M3KNN7_9ZZZZ